MQPIIHIPIQNHDVRNNDLNGKHKSLANVKEYTDNNLTLKSYGISNPLKKNYEKVLNISELNLTDDSTLIFSQSQMIPIFKFIWSASQMHVFLIIFLNRICKHGRQTLTYSQSLITVKLLFICVLIFLKQGTKHQRLRNRFLLRKSMDWFLYDNGLRHERVK